MKEIIKLQILSGFRDAKFIFFSAIVLLAFIVNAFVFSAAYQERLKDYEVSLQYVNDGLQSNKDSLMAATLYGQQLVKPPSPLSFIASRGNGRLPNSWRVNAFMVTDQAIVGRGNKRLPLLEQLDWSFIIGSLMSLLTILMSYGSIADEKQEGTLKQVFACPIPRINVFLGKFIGLLVTLLSVLFTGVLMNLVLMVFNDALFLSPIILERIGWIILFAALNISFFLLLGIGISAIAQNPTMSLVLMIIIWVLAVAGIPGIAQLVGTQMTELRSEYEIDADIEATNGAIFNDMPAKTGRWDGNPFAEWMPDRARYGQRSLEVENQKHSEGIRQRIEQVRLIEHLSSVSPVALLSSSYQHVCETGIVGYETLWQQARLYQQQLHHRLL
jgi:ABC-type Na+ efflux pump permease subunit